MTHRNWLMVLATAAVWGSSYMFIKLALDDFSPGGVVVIRTALGAALLLSIAHATGALGALRGRLRWILVLSLLQVAAPFLLISYGERHISSSLTAILISVVPIYTTLLAMRFDHAERARGWGLVGIVTGIAGVVLLFGVDLSGDADELLGGGMMLLAALCYAISWMLAKHKAAGIPPVATSGAVMLVATVLTSPVLAATAPHHAPSLKSVAALLALGAGGTGIAFILYYTLIAEVGPGRASVVGYVAPAFSVFYGVAFLSESLSLGSIGGLALILAGSWLGAEGRPPRWLRRIGPSRSSAPAPVRAR
jgi:drug/metabolite transporter (DMT)-like permease